MGSNTYSVIFYVVKHNFPISFPGILGNDIIVSLKLQIPLKYIEKSILQHHSNSTSSREIPQIQKETVINKENDSPNSTDFLTIPACTEMLISVNILNPEIKEGLIDKRALEEGLYLLDSLVKVNEQCEAITSVVNITEVDKKIFKPKLKLKQLDKNFLKIMNSNGNSNVNSKSSVDYRSIRTFAKSAEKSSLRSFK